jgi:hypothetical protein
MIKRLTHRIGHVYVSHLTSSEHKAQQYTRTNERPIEYGFAFDWLNRLQPKTVLDVGTGDAAFPALARTCGFVVSAIDNIRDYWPDGMVSRRSRIGLRL